MRLASVLLFATLVSAQSSGIVTNAPFSADEIIETTRILPDGTQAANDPVISKVYRDSRGRTRREGPSIRRNVSSGTNTFGSPTVTIIDPVAQVQYFFSTDHVGKTFRSSTWRQQPPLVPSSSADSEVTSQSLGPKTIEGLTAEGTLTTTIWPAGSHGNDEPVTLVNESWRSPELQIVIVNKTTSPFSGERSTRLIHIVRGEPPADLFRPPTGHNKLAPPVASRGVYKVGGDVTSPQVVSRVEPQYSEEARKAQFSGTLLLALVVDENGLPRDIKVIHPIGLGLDEKAIEAVMKWRFRPGTKDGHPVPTQATIEVAFRLP